MREKLLCILLVTSLSLNAQRRSDSLYCGIPQKTGEDLKLKKGFNNNDPGVLISGQDPGPTTTIRIRCGSTVSSGNEPLYVVDGVLYEFAQIKSINPNAIVAIDILKPPVADAIYGYRALHGVVIITTNKFYERKFVIKDAKDRLGIGYATISATSIITGDSVSFVANEFGVAETNLLKSLDYKVKISCIGYKSKELSLKEIIKNSNEIHLEKSIVNLNEVIIESLGWRRTSCGLSFTKIYGVGHLTSKSNYKTELKIYPNPVSSSAIVNLSFPNVKEGLYQIRLLNAAGQLFYSVQKQISKNETEQIHLSSQMIPGIYVLQIIDAKKKLIQTSELIIQ